MSSLPVAAHSAGDLALYENSAGFQAFVQRALQAPFLSAEEEYALACRLQDHDDLEAAHTLVRAYLRLVIKTAREYLHYHVSLTDLVQEGTIGLMYAVRKFDPRRGNRLAAYAIWWIRAAMHDFILRSWRMVKMATTQIKRQLFFKLRQNKTSCALLNQDEAEELAQRFGTSSETILEVDCHMAGADESLNQYGTDDTEEWIDRIPDQRPNPEHLLLSSEHKQRATDWIRAGLQQLTPRERWVVSARFLEEEPRTLEALAQVLSISRERVRQVEKRAMEKLHAFFQNQPDLQEWVVESR
ncbi:MAG: RNA polymerase factor sigma-32 [Magnetococcales bacterium]|nr:RNA polymerase factor sigma-32 [Magnetococcales bacterium]